MTEREKKVIREKVIKGLECCLPMTTRNGFADCKQCPYYKKITLEGGIIECCHDLMTDALALLKAQEPRVLTLEEVFALPCDTPIYIENCDSLNGWDVFAGITKDDEKDVVTGAQWSTCEYWPQDEYGDTWRCWTSRPSDEVRRATPWN